MTTRINSDAELCALELAYLSLHWPHEILRGNGTESLAAGTIRARLEYKDR